ncbi:DUF4275 family protein [Bacillus sp. REN16]|uniref:DUF4275 family protein n=1 Tax=Bacillus sp. REN16 TaxID=2887296 RepID=UPI001E4A78F9|nr:DUF4275 family protein [Bacillus sp. REN16]MCC3356047.1 DUF4275 family protein [Bacillus sp. REN16]
MDFFNRLKKKKMRVLELPKWGAYLRGEWESHFAAHLNDAEKRIIHLNSSNGYLWHLFSYEKKKCFDGDDAEEAFNLEQKNKCYIFYQHWDYALLVENASRLCASDLGDETDIYVVDKDFRWTFVITHETGWCGPYFSRKDK